MKTVKGLIALSLFLFCSPPPAAACWAAISLEEFVRSSDMVVTGELTAIDFAGPSDAPDYRAHDRGTITVAEVLFQPGGEPAVETGGEITLLMPSVNNRLVMSTDIRHENGRQGVWILARDGDSFRAGHPMSFQPAAREPEARQAVDRVRREVSAKALEPFSRGLDRFALEVFGRVREAEKPGENIVLSPYSIRAAFLLAHLGMDGETREEAARALAVDDLEPGDLYRLVAEMRAFLESGEGVTLEIANALFLKRDFPFREEFVEQAGRRFDAAVDTLPETGGPINDWVAEKTRGTIRELIDPDSPIPAEVIAWLLNAVYFHGHWDREFDAEKTRDDIFTNRAGAEKKVRMMEAERRFPYFADETVQALALPYRGGEFRMLVFLPAPGTLDDFESGLDLDLLERARQGMRPREVLLQMPRFRLEYETGLNEAMQAAGLRLAFSRHEADFSRMVDLGKTGGENVYISKARHKAFIEVDEKGTEAAAVTGIQISITSMPPPPERMRLDRPFYFLVEEKNTGAILFLGRAADL